MILVFDSFESIECYKNSWNRLSKKLNNALLSYEWFSCCASAFHSNDTLYIVCIFNNNELSAVAPLCKSTSCRHLHIIGSRRLYEPTSLLYEDESSLYKLVDACIDIGFPILLSRCFDREYRTSELSLIKSRSIFITKLSVSSQFLEIENDFITYESMLTSRKRYDIRRAVKKAENYGVVDSEINDVNTNNLRHLLEKAYEIENFNWKGRAGSSISKNYDLKEFFSCLFNNLSSYNNKGIISFLTINKKPVAAQLSIQQFDRLWILKIGYDENYSSCSPGVLLMHEVIRYAHDNRLQSVEFLGNEESWISSWKPCRRDYFNHIIYPLSTKGVTGLLLDASNILINKINSAIFK